MRELDVWLSSFLEQEWDDLSDEDLLSFETLLACTDEQLLRWLTGRAPTDEPALSVIIGKIIAKNSGSRG